MNQIAINEPQFVTRFTCIGSDCLDHCCKEWSINFDKATVNRYLKSPQIEIKTIAASAFDISKKSLDNWATVSFNSNLTCAFMDEASLCKVHKTLGPSALSPTCAIYPRQKSSFREEENNSLTVSCPEATRLLLSDPDAMLLNQRMHATRQVVGKKKPLNQLNKLINVMAMTLVKTSGQEIEQGLYALATLMLMLQKQVAGKTQSVEQLENTFVVLLQGLENGEIGEKLHNIKPDHQLQWALLMRLQVYLDNRVHTHGLVRLRFYINRLLQIQTRDIESGEVSTTIERLESTWQNRVKPWLAQRPWFLNNYLQYRIYHDNFPGDQLSNPLKPLYLLTAEWYLIKALIAATAELTGEITEADVIGIIYSFHSVAKHNPLSAIAFTHEIDQVKVNDDLSLLYLLR